MTTLGHRPTERDEDPMPLLEVNDITDASHDSSSLQESMQIRRQLVVPHPNFSRF